MSWKGARHPGNIESPVKLQSEVSIKKKNTGEVHWSKILKQHWYHSFKVVNNAVVVGYFSPQRWFCWCYGEWCDVKSHWNQGDYVWAENGNGEVLEWGSVGGDGEEMSTQE